MEANDRIGDLKNSQIAKRAISKHNIGWKEKDIAYVDAHQKPKSRFKRVCVRASKKRPAAEGKTFDAQAFTGWRS